MRNLFRYITYLGWEYKCSMGNSNSRPRICQVAPSHSQTMEDEPSLFPTSPWMITAVKGTKMQEKGIVGQRKTNCLPPLAGRHKIPNSVHLEPGHGMERWACPLLFHSQPERALWRKQNTTDEMEGGQRVRLASRTMQQNIFWDESEGQILDVRELLQPSPQVIDPNVGDTLSDKPLMENGNRKPEM